MKLKLWRKNLPENWTKAESKELLDQMLELGVDEVRIQDDYYKRLSIKWMKKLAIFDTFFVIFAALKSLKSLLNSK
ncbi:hypothetical protein [Lishizhenia sp.]|uniref:hypothetical protein n=1 Tax=Lishizhenia sp. TaxID=2497594 RepID=UPI00299F30AD|nr:hypothetical protein [Lishizhenia sp.]MDX1446621.1 hypothetical protein [Lishizhenia sp.]